jgi:hypothetical protein
MFDNIFNINRFWGVLGQGFFSGVIGIVVGILVLKILKNEELENVWQSLKSKKLFRTKPVSSGQEEVQ